ncbi:MAG: xanthine dehydrogenase family protein molybdopterin-binding subunit [Firmicutes bacterium]|nr:xanthine dehydrogenase family protein molybdopterin-binding subunit [Bacillota bacterium]
MTLAQSRSYRVIGTRPVRHDGVDKVTGRAQYGADVRLPGMLYGCVVRSPYPHARLRAIDTSRAAAHPGVKAVITGADMPAIDTNAVADLGEGAIELKFASLLIMARDKVVFRGQPVAAVAAVSPQAAAEAARLVEVDYEPLPVVTDALAAMEPGSPRVHDDLYTVVPGGSRRDSPSNIALHVQYERGDVEAGFAGADVVVEREFRTAMVHQGYIEPQNATAAWEPGGRLTVWTSTQGAFSVRQQLSDLLQIPVGRIKVVPMEIGGGFGGKIQVYLEPLAALLSRKAGRPVKMWMSRAEVFTATGPGPATYIRLKMGVTRTGDLTAAAMRLVYDAGAFPGSPVGSACITGLSPYRIPHFRIDGFDVVTNKPRVQAYRAPGAPPAAFAVETVLDELAEAIGMDPIELRLRNAAAEGDRMTNGVAFNRIGFKEVLVAAKNHPHYRAPLPPGATGRGVAAGFWMNGRGTSTVHLTFNPDGTVNLIEGSTDIGGSRASLAMIVAEELGLDAHDVKPVVADTDSVGHTDVTGGSRVTYSTGVACHRAALDAIAQLKPRAAQLLDANPGDVEFGGGEFWVSSEPRRRIGIKEVIAKLGKTGGPIVARGVSRGLAMAPGFGVHIADVRVDPETGKVDVVRYTAVQDAGKAIHPTYVEGQLQGGAAQGVGLALFEEYVFEDGILRNPSFLDYRMPTALDLPMIDTVIVEVPASDGPYGVRGVGEVPIVPPAAAIANAIYRAAGVRLRQLPMTPENVWRALAGRDAALPSTPKAAPDAAMAATKERRAEPPGTSG